MRRGRHPLPTLYIIYVNGLINVNINEKKNILNDKVNSIGFVNTMVENRMERERSCFMPIYNFRLEKEPSTAASESANQELRGGSRRAYETWLPCRCSRIRCNKERSHETE